MSGDTAVIIPCNNEAESLASLLPRCLKIRGLEYLVVDDGSIDETTEVAEYFGFSAIRSPERLGRSLAVRRALKFSNADRYGNLVIMDGDGQHPPEVLPQFIDLLHKGKRVVCGNRFGATSEQRGTPPDRRFLARILCGAISELVGIRFSDPGCGMIGVERESMQKLDGELLWGSHLSMEIVVRLALSGLQQSDLGEIDIAAIYDGTSSRQLMKYQGYSWERRLIPRIESHVRILYEIIAS